MLLVYFEGFALSAAMIIAIGAQNAFVISQGIKREYHLMIASICAMSDAILIILGVFGGAALLSRSPVLLQLVTWSGVSFLLYYGYCAFKQALYQSKTDFTEIKSQSSRWKTLLTLLIVTWLNPHVYLDTVVIIGSAASQLMENARIWFAFGAVSASVIWFFMLAMLAAWLAPCLQTAKAQRIINLLIALIMWLIALQLAINGYYQLISLFN